MEQERDPKRQRFSLGGPSVDTSFEDYLTGTHTNISSDEEEYDQENRDPGNELNQDDEEYDEEEGEEEEEEEEDDNQSSSSSSSSSSSDRNYPNDNHQHPSTITISTASPHFFARQIHNSSRLPHRTQYPTPEAYLLHLRIVCSPLTPPEISRILRVPSVATFDQLSRIIRCAFAYTGDKTWEFSLRKPPMGLSEDDDDDDGAETETSREMLVVRSKPCRHVLEGGPYHSPVQLKSKRVRLMDVWGSEQDGLVRALQVFFENDVEVHPRRHRVTFMGVAAEGLEGGDLGVDVGGGQEVWCVDGRGRNLGEGERVEDYVESRSEGVDRIDIRNINSQLGTINLHVE